MLRDRDAVLGLLQQARRNGCDTLLFTVDLPVAGIRRRDIRNGMLDASWRGRLAKATQLAQRPGWLLDVGIRGRPHHFGNLSDRVADPSDRRALNIVLTEAGLAIWRDINHCGQRVRDRAVQDMDAGEREQLFRLLDQVLRNLTPPHPND